MLPFPPFACSLTFGTRNAIGSEDTDMGFTDTGVANVIAVGENDLVLSESGAMNDIGAENLDVELSGVPGIIAVSSESDGY